MPSLSPWFKGSHILVFQLGLSFKDVISVYCHLLMGTEVLITQWCWRWMSPDPCLWLLYVNTKGSSPPPPTSASGWGRSYPVTLSSHGCLSCPKLQVVIYMGISGFKMGKYGKLFIHRKSLPFKLCRMGIGYHALRDQKKKQETR